MKLHFLLILILTLSFSTYSQSNFALRIKLSVNSPSPSLQKRIYESLTNEISNYNDIKIVETGFIFEYEVVAIEVKTSKNVFVSYALSNLISRTVLCEQFPSNVGKYSPILTPLTHSITFTNNENMSKTSKELIEYLNIRYLDPVRNASKQTKSIN